VRAAGKVTLETHSPLTIGSAGLGAGGAITLTAGNSGAGGTGDNLTINGPVTSSGGGAISLSAGNSITGSNVPTGSNVSLHPNGNPAAPQAAVAVAVAVAVAQNLSALNYASFITPALVSTVGVINDALDKLLPLQASSSDVAFGPRLSAVGSTEQASDSPDTTSGKSDTQFQRKYCN
jgi:hypothetical protein